MIAANILGCEKAAKEIFFTAWAMAVAENPSSSLRLYYSEHEERLKAAAKIIREKAKELLKDENVPVPFTNAQWLTWMEASDQLFKDIY